MTLFNEEAIKTSSLSLYISQLAIEKYFQNHMEEMRKSFGGLPISVAVDVRYDTPGNN